MHNYRARGITADNKPIFDEDHEHITVANWLTINGVFFIHVPNEGKRSWAIGKKLKRMGMMKGVSDFIVFDSPPLYRQKLGAVLELKALDGRAPGEDQTEFLEQMNNRAYMTHWCRGSDAAIEWFESLGYRQKRTVMF